MTVDPKKIGALVGPGGVALAGKDKARFMEAMHDCEEAVSVLSRLKSNNVDALFRLPGVYAGSARQLEQQLGDAIRVFQSLVTRLSNEASKR